MMVGRRNTVSQGGAADADREPHAHDHIVAHKARGSLIRLWACRFERKHVDA